MMRSLSSNYFDDSNNNNQHDRDNYDDENWRDLTASLLAHFDNRDIIIGTNNDHNDNDLQRIENSNLNDISVTDTDTDNDADIDTSRLLSASDLVAAADASRYYWTPQRNAAATFMAVRLLDAIVETLHHRPDLHRHWYDAHYQHFPRATQLVNAVLDSWRLSMKNHNHAEHNNSTIISVPRMQQIVVHRWVQRGLPIDARTHTIWLTAAVRHHPTEAPLWGQAALSQALAAPEAAVDAVFWTALLHAWGQSGRSDRVEGALQLWDDWQALLRDHQLVDCHPTTESFNTLIHILSNSTSNSDEENYVERADEFLRMMQVEGSHGVVPDTVTFQLVIFGWANRALAMAGKQSSKKIDRHSKMQSAAGPTGASNDQLPNPDPLQRAYRLLRDMVELDVAGHQHVQPNATVFAKLISTATRLGRYGLAEEMRHDLFELRQNSLQAPERYQLETHTKRALLLLYVHTDRVAQAQELLDELEEDATTTTTHAADGPKPSHYRDVLLAWIRAGEPKLAEGILERLLDLSAAASVTTSSERDEDDKFRPKPQLVHKVLWGWSRLRHSTIAGYRAELLLRNLQGRGFFSVNNDSGDHHHLEAYQHVMMAWARTKSNESAERAELLMLELLTASSNNSSGDDGPSRFHYLPLIMAWSKVRGSAGIQAVQYWFEHAKERFRETGEETLRPEASMYGAAIQGFMNNGHGALAEEYWEYMLRDFEAGGAAQPPIQIMNMVLTAWERSRAPEAPVRAVQFLERMESWSRVECDLHPNRHSLEIAIRTLSKFGPKYSEDLRRLQGQRERLND